MLLDAIRNGNADEVRRLLEQDPALRETHTEYGASAVLWACYTRHPELAPLLLGGREPDFYEACALGRADLLGEGAPVNQPAPDGFTALGLACFFRHAEAARRLLDLGADPSLPAANALKFAPLHSAVAAGSYEIVDLLLARGADPNPRDAQNNTPLHSAAGHGDPRITARLLAAGADKTARNSDGLTPPDTAEQYGKPAPW